jgi:HEAT repeat protein
LTAALPGATDYERRYRIVDGIAAVGDAAALRALAESFAIWPKDADTFAIKQVAARAIAVNPRPEALDLLVALAADDDPGVRLAALSAIAGASGGPAGPWHGPAGPAELDRLIQIRLLTDVWPEVRRHAAQVLGARCARPGPAAALADSVARDPDVGVRGDALAALVECKAASAPALLAKMWDDGKAPLELRQRAVDLAVALADRALAQQLVAKYMKWRGAAIESEKALALAQNAAFAIGRLRAPGAAEALAAALDDSAFPELVASAAAGLGLLGPACPASVRPKLKILASSDEQQVQIAAARAVEVCGK